MIFPHPDPMVISALITGILGGGLIGFLQFLIGRHDRLQREKQEIDPEKLNKLIRLSIAEAQDRICWLGEKYIEHGYVEIRDWAAYESLYLAYKDIGGNNLAKNIYTKVSNLPHLTEDEIDILQQKEKEKQESHDRRMED